MSSRMGWAASMVGRTLDAQYRVDGILGEGAMGVVFRGVNLAMDKPVAIKMMRKDTFDTPDAVERFKREARVWSQLNHPAICQVFDFGIQDGMPFLVMELIEGADLSDVLKQEGKLKPMRAVALMRQLAAALEEAHRVGVVHRDIKPQNMKLLRYQAGGRIVLKVLDTAAAKARNIRVNVLSPGPVETALFLTLPQEGRDQFIAQIPRGKAGQPEEIATAALFLATPDSSFVTGGELLVDGGVAQL